MGKALSMIVTLFADTHVPPQTQRQLANHLGRILYAVTEGQTMGQSGCSDLPLPMPGERRDPVAQSLPHCRRRLSHRFEGWINTADEGTLERSVGPKIFESLDDGLVSKPVTPSEAA